MVRIELPDGKRHFLLGSVHSQSTEHYIPNENLLCELRKQNKLFLEREMDLVHEKTWKALRDLNEEAEASEEGKNWWDFLSEEDDDDSEDEESDEVSKLGSNRLKEFFKPRKEIVRSFREDWGIAYMSMLSLWRFWDVDALDDPTLFDLSEEDIEVKKPVQTSFEDELEEKYRADGKKIGYLETSRTFFQDVFQGLRFITDEGDKEEKRKDLDYFSYLINTMITNIGEEKSDGEEDLSPKTDYIEVDGEEVVENIFLPNEYIFEDNYIDRGFRRRDIRMAESMKESMEMDDMDALYIVGANHVFGILTKLSPWLEEKGYTFSFLRQTEDGSGFKFVKAALNATGNAYEYVE